MTRIRCRDANLPPTWQHSVEARRAVNPAIANEKRILAAACTKTAATLKRPVHNTLDAGNR
jgi:hypothetical protein